MRTLQKFWRTSADRLKQDRQHVARRMKALERSVLAKELNVAEPVETEKRRTVQKKATQEIAVKKLSLEERVHLALMDDADRTEFVRNEMRTRRFMMLPKMYVWQEDMDKYW